MGFALDLGELMQRAGLSAPAPESTPAPASRDPAPPASPANRLIPAPDVSHLATLAGVAAPVDAMPEQVTRDHRPDLVAAAWTDDDITRFLDRRTRLMRWGWAEPDAEKLAERLARRDRERDDRVSCTDCRHYRPGRCGNHLRAGLHAADLSRDLAGLLQRCHGHSPRSST